jgi:parallel beta-helix repeat protein
MQDKLFRKGLVVGIILLFVGAGIIPSIVGINVERHVSQDNKPSFIDSNIPGETLYVGGDGPGNYSTIQEAIDDAKDGDLFDRDTVFVLDDSSPYHENVIVDKTIILKGENRETTVIDGTGSNDPIVWVTDAFCLVLNLKITGDNSNKIGVKISSSKNYVSNCSITNVDQGIYVSQGTKDGYFSRNIISNVEEGVTIYYSDHNYIGSNYISNCEQYGVFVSGTNNDYHFENTHISYNEIFNNNKGVYMENINDSKIWGNYVHNNTGGFEFSASNGNKVYCNNFENNDDWSAQDEGISTWDVFDKKGNYWDDYDGIDADGDGIGDTPYPIPGGDNVDRYPQMEFWENFPPSKPIITGPTTGSGLVKIDFTFKSIDPNGDDLYYIVKWGDGDVEVFGKHPSGVEITVNHTYYSLGEKTIEAYASDEFYWSGSLSKFTITITKSRIAHNNLLVRILEQLPILQKILLLQR